MYGDLYNYIETKVLHAKLHKSNKKHEEFKNRVINTLSSLATACLAERLWNYLSYVNVAEEDRKYVKAKSEFHMPIVIVTYAKKSYIAYVTRQESVVFDTPQIDTKGVNFFKSTASEKTSKFIYDALLRDELFEPKDGKISLRRIYKKIINFQESIKADILKGDMGFLKRGIKIKSLDAYADPMRISQARAVVVWNSIMPEKEHIQLPATTTFIKVKLTTKKDVAALAPWPEIYEKVMALFDNPEFGDHMEMKDGKERLVKGKGINAIALPNSYDDVPDWILAVIDADLLVQNNMSLMVQLAKPLGFSAGQTSINKNSATWYTNIVRC